MTAFNSPHSVHSGFCNGGPFAGKRLTMRGTRNRISILDHLGPIQAPETVLLNEGAYEWDAEDSSWIWKPDFTPPP